MNDPKVEVKPATVVIVNPGEPDIPMPLGPEGVGVVVSPGDRLKNAPEDYWPGGAKAQLDYWKGRALAAEARLKLRLEEIEALKARIP